MAIGRADAWNSPFIPVAVTGRAVVWNLRADPIWASGHGAAQQAGHMNAVDLQPILVRCLLEPQGPSTHGMIPAAPSPDPWVSQPSSCVMAARGAAIHEFGGISRESRGWHGQAITRRRWVSVCAARYNT